MSDLPTTLYDSSSNQAVDRQITQAVQSGITGFITSWPGPGTTQDSNLATLLSRATVYQKKTGTHFVSSVYIESDSDGIRNNLTAAMRYVNHHYVNNGHFFHWQGQPVIFIWDPLGQGRTLKTWEKVRRQVDPQHRQIWSAEGTDITLLNVFDGLHFFSAAYWGLLQNNMSAVDQSFRARVTAYNSAHHTRKVWAAGIVPGYDDTRVPGRIGAYRVPRRNGATYRTSWTAALSSHPDWITLTTFNEWFEGSMIEPSKAYGNLYLNLTKQYAQQWRRQ